MEKIKYVHRQDSGFKLNAGNSGETSLNLSNEIFDLIAKGTLQLGEEKEITFKIYKEDCIKAICFIILKLPLYQSSSNSSVKVTDSIATFRSLSDSVNSFFGPQESANYTVNLYYRKDGRIYLNHLRVNDFSIRDILVENYSALLFKEETDGIMAIRILSNIQEGDVLEDGSKSSINEILRNKAAATFLRGALRLTKEKDRDFSNLTKLHKYEKSSKQLKINGFPIGRDKQQLPTRLEDVDMEVEWYYDNVEYVLYLEWTPEMMENLFFPIYNEAYYGIFHMEKDSNNEYVLYEIIGDSPRDTLQKIYYDATGTGEYIPFLTAIRTKPFMLLAGISGTGKSRIVRELAKACWKEGDEEYGKNHPRNFCMVQVKPNWHDSSELFGYVSRISGKPEFVAGDFLKFVVKAWEETDVPYFICLDEMNLAPVEQYFAEYLSVIESRKSENGVITTDPIFKKPFENRVYDINIKYGEEIDWYQKLIIQLTSDEDLQKQFYEDGISIPNNLFVVGTVNMDETTFSFSRKVLDRAMTIEMNEVNLHSGLTDEGSEIGYIGNCIIGTAAEGKDVYANNKELSDQVLAYLEKVNAVLEGTPFKIAYRTRNEFLLYAVNRQLLDKDSQLWQTLDEMTSMKILSRIEGDSERTKSVLEGLKVLVEEEINKAIPEPEEGKEKLKSITNAKIEEMLGKLKLSGYTSYWA